MKTIKKRLILQRGFSLVELLIVILIVGFAVATLTNLPSSISLIGKSSHSSLAKDIVSSQIENLRAQGYASLVNNMPQGAAIVDSRLSSLPSGVGVYFIDDCLPSICTNSEETKTLTVRVEWMEKGDSKSFELVTLVSEGGL